jgi:hypothetical protein
MSTTLPPTTLARLPKHVARLNSCVARLRAAGHRVAFALSADGGPPRVDVLVDGATPEVAAARATIEADAARRRPAEEVAMPPASKETVAPPSSTATKQVATRRRRSWLACVRMYRSSASAPQVKSLRSCPLDRGSMRYWGPLTGARFGAGAAWPPGAEPCWAPEA